MAEEGVSTEQIAGSLDDTRYVEVMYARSRGEARDCCRLLATSGILARMEEPASTPRLCGIAVLVPTDRFVEASELLACQASSGPDFDENADDDYDDDAPDDYDEDDDGDYDDDYDDDEDEDDDYEDDDVDDDYEDDDYEDDEGDDDY